MSMLTIMKGLVQECDGSPLADVAIFMEGGLTYITDKKGCFEYASEAPLITINRIERAGFQLVSPTLPLTNFRESPLPAIVMRRQETPEQVAVREAAHRYFDQSIQLIKSQRRGEAADVLIKRALLDPNNVHWTYMAGSFLHKIGDYRTAQTMYNRAIEKAKELYGEKNQYLAICFELYGDNYFEWDAWAESGMNASNMHYADAKTYYNYACAYWKALLGENCNQVAHCYKQIGKCWEKLENDEEAFAKYEQALQILRSIPNPDRETEATIYMGLAGIYIGRADYVTALSLVRKALVLSKALYGDDHSYTKQLQQQVEMLEQMASQK